MRAAGVSSRPEQGSSRAKAVAKKLTQELLEMEARGEVRRLRDAAGNLILKGGNFIWELTELGQKIALAEWEENPRH
jgi:hypothetical protein